MGVCLNPLTSEAQLAVDQMMNHVTTAHLSYNNNKHIFID